MFTKFTKSCCYKNKFTVYKLAFAFPVKSTVTITELFESILLAELSEAHMKFLFHVIHTACDSAVYILRNVFSLV